LQEALENQLDTLDLSSQFLSYVPESFGRISSLVILNLSNNRLEVSTCIFHPIQCRFDTSFM
jgi:Leucine-rich repeat (LRR) protein